MDPKTIDRSRISNVVSDWEERAQEEDERRRGLRKIETDPKTRQQRILTLVDEIMQAAKIDENQRKIVLGPKLTNLIDSLNPKKVNEDPQQNGLDNNAEVEKDASNQSLLETTNKQIIIDNYKLVLDSVRALVYTSVYPSQIDSDFRASLIKAEKDLDDLYFSMDEDARSLLLESVGSLQHALSEKIYYVDNILHGNDRHEAFMNYLGENGPVVGIAPKPKGTK